jgi:hypothetical protein
MKFFLQDCLTSKFMRCDSTWSANINEALDFFSERRAFLFGMKELDDPFRILKIAAETLLPVPIPQLVFPKSLHMRLVDRVRAAGHVSEKMPSQFRLGSKISGGFALPGTLNKHHSKIPNHRPIIYQP